MERDATEHGVEFSRSGLDNLLNSTEEEEVTEELTLQELGCKVAFPDDDVVSEAAQDEYAEEEALSLQQELHCLAQSITIIERNGSLCDEGLKAFSSFQLSLRLNNVSPMNQKTILDHFPKKLSTFPMSICTFIPLL